MKTSILLNVMALIFSQNIFASNINSLECNNGKNTISITEIGNSKINIHFDQNNNYEISKAIDGDCQNRAQFMCYQEGQLMVNIPNSLGKGFVTSGKVWINLDTDDDESFSRMGEAYMCHWN